MSIRSLSEVWSREVLTWILTFQCCIFHGWEGKLMCILFCPQPSIKCFLWDIALNILVKDIQGKCPFLIFGEEPWGPTYRWWHPFQLLCGVKYQVTLNSSHCLIHSPPDIKGRDYIYNTKGWSLLDSKWNVNNRWCWPLCCPVFRGLWGLNCWWRGRKTGCCLRCCECSLERITESCWSAVLCWKLYCDSIVLSFSHLHQESSSFLTEGQCCKELLTENQIFMQWTS